MFEVIFPDSKIASQIELGKIKLMYIVKFGIAPYFREILKNETVNSEWYTQLVLMKVCGAIDFGITYQIRFKLDFGTACFFGHSTSTDLLKHFSMVIQGTIPQRIFKFQSMTLMLI